MWCPRKGKVTSWPKPIRCSITRRVNSIRSTACSRNRRGAPLRAKRIHRYLENGCAKRRRAMRALSGLRPQCAKVQAWSSLSDVFQSVITLQKLPVVFAIDRAGVVGADGATHMGAYDLAFLRCIPNLTVMAASDENECWQMLNTAAQLNGPAAVRYPRGSGPGAPVFKHARALPIGRGEMRRESAQPCGQRIAILAFGTMVAQSLIAAEQLDASVANMRFVKPLDQTLVVQLAQTHDALVTVEEGCVMGGAGSACIESLLAHGIERPMLQLGLSDRFIDHGDPARLLTDHGLDGEGIAQAIQNRFSSAAQRFSKRVA